MRTPSAGATGVIIETERLRMRAHRDGDLTGLGGVGRQLGNRTLDGYDTAPLQRNRWARVDRSRTGNHAAGQPRRFAIEWAAHCDLVISSAGGPGTAGPMRSGSNNPGGSSVDNHRAAGYPKTILFGRFQSQDCKRDNRYSQPFEPRSRDTARRRGLSNQMRRQPNFLRCASFSARSVQSLKCGSVVLQLKEPPCLQLLKQ